MNPVSKSLASSGLMKGIKRIQRMSTFISVCTQSLNHSPGTSWKIRKGRKNTQKGLRGRLGQRRTTCSPSLTDPGPESETETEVEPSPKRSKRNISESFICLNDC